MGPLAQLIIQSLPDIVALIQQAHADANPDAPELTAEQITAAFDEAFASSIAKDEILKAMLGG